MSRIFISYRRDDSGGYAGRLYDRLSQHFGDDNVFMDVDTIEPGLDFVEVIEKAVDACDVLIALIGKQWLTVTDASGQRRLDNPNDFVRLEIQTALERNIRVIPALIRGATMPTSPELPEALTRLARRNAIELNDIGFHDDANRLIKTLEGVLSKPAAPSLPAEAERLAAKKAESERKAQEEADRLETEKAEAERLAAEKVEAERLTAEKAEIERKAQEEVDRKAKEQIIVDRKPQSPISTSPSQLPTPKPQPQTPRPQTLRPTHYFELERISPKLLKLLSDPMWQMLGVLVAIIGVAGAVYTFYGGNSPFTPAPTPKPPATIATDGSPMVLVPAGPFEMGSNQGESDEQPVHEVTLSAFYIDQYEVTNALYRSCVEAGGCEPPGCTERYEAWIKKNHPVVCVHWNQAKKYCEWRRGRLPTEAEWEKAARGTDGRTYPWGDQPPDETLLNFNSNEGDTTPVGSYPNGVSPYGAYDMAGNVWEWVADWYGKEYYSNSPAENPSGPQLDEGYKVRRGGSWDNAGNYARAVYRYSNPFVQSGSLGFRCAAAVP